MRTTPPFAVARFRGELDLDSAHHVAAAVSPTVQRLLDLTSTEWLTRVDSAALVR